MTPLTPAASHRQPRQTLDFDCGVRAYPPTHPDGYWRLRWMEADRRRETTATSKDEVLAKAADVVEHLAQGRPTDWAQAKGEALVAHYLDPTRRPARGRAWSARHREEQQAYCSRFVTPVIADVELSHLSRVHFSRILAQAPPLRWRRICAGAVRPWWPPGWRRACSWPARTCSAACAGARRRTRLPPTTTLSDASSTKPTSPRRLP